MFNSFSLSEQGLSEYFDGKKQGNVTVQNGAIFLYQWFEGIGLRKRTVETHSNRF